MDHGGEGGFSNGNVRQIIPEMPTSGNMDNWAPGFNDQSIWATEEDYGFWNGDLTTDNPSNSNYDGRQSQSRQGSEPPNKILRINYQGGDSLGSGFGRDFTSSGNRSRLIGKMFFKTKMCCKFRIGTCPYVTNCNFAHSMEELRKPPPNWQEIVASQDEDRGMSSEPREEHQIPSLSSAGLGSDIQRSYKGRHCKRFYTDEGCPYGDSCTFLHDEQSKARESVAISLGPTMGGGYGNNANASTQKPSNWKTRICNKWEMTGYCPFGSKCHFAHGSAELHRYGGGPADTEGKDSPLAPQDLKQLGVPSKMPTDSVIPSTMSAPHGEVYHMGGSTQRSSALNQRPGQRPVKKWKGPDKISRIYGDWLDDIEDPPR